MANRTVKDAHSIHGTNPQYLVEKIIRTRIYESKYWKEECFGLTGERDRARRGSFVPTGRRGAGGSVSVVRTGVPAVCLVLCGSWRAQMNLIEPRRILKGFLSSWSHSPPNGGVQGSEQYSAQEAYVAP